MAQNTDQGTGKHPHKSTEEPYPHHEGKSREGEKSERTQASAGQPENKQSQSGQERGESADLKQREYRDAEGNVHHHTHTYEEQHGKK